MMQALARPYAAAWGIWHPLTRLCCVHTVPPCFLYLKHCLCQATFWLRSSAQASTVCLVPDVAACRILHLILRPLSALLLLS